MCWQSFIFGVILTLSTIMVGCVFTQTTKQTPYVSTDIMSGSAVKCWLTAGHVIDGAQHITVDGVNVEHKLLGVRTVPYNNGYDTIVLLVPQKPDNYEELKGQIEPGDSGSAVYKDGEFIGIIGGYYEESGDPIVLTMD